MLSINENNCQIKDKFCGNEKIFHDKFPLVREQKAFEEVEDNQHDHDIYYPEDSFGLHICTRRPCNCYIANCYTYCFFNWCHNSPTQDSAFFPCHNLKRISECRYLMWPCKNYC